MIARLTPLWALAALLALWELAVALLKIPASQLPPPSLIVATLYAQAPQLLDAAATTLGEALLALALLFSLSPLLERAFLPVAVALQVTPLIAVAPLLLIYLEPRAAVLACAALVAFFPVLSNAAAGLRGADRGLVELFRLKGASRAAILFRLRLPSALPSIFTGLRIGAGLALIGAVAAELAAGAAGQGEGLAFRIVEAGYRLKVPTMYAAVLLLCLCGVALYGVLAGLDRILLRRWRDEPDV
ncbi:ABC transporter ATP-binding protein [Rhodoblastus acidophilus]|uniref:ABC transporter permease n=1 Tax=Rhodoblastus acidophilus TaxID=1074 RepID=UPI000CECA49A|nr:ABC transporter permease subunit [Rhodoblastus acidophilus]PPQ40078.1 ABC transporter ATP-binding protein [Rhodoblastus acidophilus]